LNEDKIDFTKFSQNFGKGQLNSFVPLEKILVENSSFSRSHLKKRLIKNGLLEKKCQICGMEPTWNNNPLSLVLDHINGVNNDNRIENLRLLCPNCNSQTSTFAGRQLKKQFYCSECHKVISRWGERCRSCATKGQVDIGERPTKIDWPDTKVLIEMVNASSYLAVARKLGVSDNAIRKRIRNH